MNVKRISLSPSVAVVATALILLYHMYRRRLGYIGIHRYQNSEQKI